MSRATDLHELVTSTVVPALTALDVSGSMECGVAHGEGPARGQGASACCLDVAGCPRTTAVAACRLPA